MSSEVRAPNTEHPLALGSFRSWFKLLWDGGDIDGRFIPRVLFVSLTTLLTSPLRLYEQARYGRVVQSTPIHSSPIFIVGHWRTGTTHLHNLMCRGQELGLRVHIPGDGTRFLLGRGKKDQTDLGQMGPEDPSHQSDRQHTTLARCPAGGRVRDGEHVAPI